MFEQTINIDRIEHIVNLFGNFDENIKAVEKEYQVSVSSHSGEIKIKGDAEPTDRFRLRLHYFKGQTGEAQNARTAQIS